MRRGQFLGWAVALAVVLAAPRPAEAEPISLEIGTTATPLLPTSWIGDPGTGIPVYTGSAPGSPWTFRFVEQPTSYTFDLTGGAIPTDIDSSARLLGNWWSVSFAVVASAREVRPAADLVGDDRLVAIVAGRHLKPVPGHLGEVGGGGLSVGSWNVSASDATEKSPGNYNLFLDKAESLPHGTHFDNYYHSLFVGVDAGLVFDDIRGFNIHSVGTHPDATVPTPIPAPPSVVLLAVGAACAGCWRRRARLRMAGNEPAT